jgi:hypothetical protein
MIAAGGGMALRWIGCILVTFDITTLRRYLLLVQIKGRPKRTGFAFFRRHHLCLSVDICVYLCCYCFLHICRTDHRPGVSMESKIKHRYTQISTDKHRWTLGRIAWPDTLQGLVFGTTAVGSAQFRRSPS